MSGRRGLAWSAAAVVLLVAGTAARYEANKAGNDPQERWRNELPPFERVNSADKQVHYARPQRVTLVTFSNCGTDHDPIQLRSLDVPDVINLKSTFNLSADVVLTAQVQSPIKVTMKVQRHVLFWWVTIPCLEGAIGSCSFKDACQLIPTPTNGTCPPFFVENHIPCLCPVGPGEYRLDNVLVDLAAVHIPEELAAGVYYARVRIEHGAGLLGCFAIQLRLE
ncbi:uncharacterized protein LOC119110880 [Pollicipes pollicipes]|uniref:uncharacterized protein LOC119110880 n=1 Tax=Pollicipes pollicipes TaxID=41117 RepID=UPI0018851857|nr:uncharacterized protein LOC119110880 [Pollicipes pollicipes]